MLIIVSLEALPNFSYIQYLVQLQANKTKALFKLDYKINIITSAFIAKSSFEKKKTSVSKQKINGFILQAYNMASVGFLF